MDNIEKERTRSLYELYGTAKFGINKTKFDKLEGNLDNQIKDSMKLIYYNKLVPQNYGYYIISFTIITAFFIVFSRQFVLNFFETAKSDWENYKCDPRIMPYSGYVKTNEGSTEFMSTGDNFNECIEPISRYIAMQKFRPFESVVSFDLTSLTQSMNSSFEKLQGTMNKLKDITGNIISMLSVEENKKNEETQEVQQIGLSSMLSVNALMKSIADLVTGVNVSIQSLLTYIYGFFEGALVLLTLYIVGFYIIGSVLASVALGVNILGLALLSNPFTLAAAPGVLANSPILAALSFTFLGVAFAFFLIFLAVVIIMLMYAEFLKFVFNVDVHSRKTSTPQSPL